MCDEFSSFDIASQEILFELLFSLPFSVLGLWQGLIRFLESLVAFGESGMYLFLL